MLEIIDQIELPYKQKPLYYESIVEELKKRKEFSDDAVFVINRAEVRNRYQLIQSLLPNCKHYFALKSCPQQGVVEEIKKLGGCFDVASSGEIKLLQDCNVPMSTCIHTHPIKKQSEIIKAIEAGIQVFVIDSEDELIKFEAYKKQVKLLVRIAFSNQEAAIDLSSKFGIEGNRALHFIIQAVMKGFTIEGVSFHVGSQMPKNDQYLRALAFCHDLFIEASNIGIQLNVLDIGGGFPFYANQDAEILNSFFQPIQTYLDNHFQGVTCIAEPGRFVSASVATLICKVIGKSVKKDVVNYYLNDGVYGCLSNQIFDFYDMNSLKILNHHTTSVEHLSSTLFGPTCDSIDVVCKNVMLPKMQVGDVLAFGNMGAYTIASTTDFNMLGLTKVVVLDIV